MKDYTNNENMKKFAQLVSELTARTITTDHIHIGEGRYYYIQPTEARKPMLLYHYRSAMFIDMHIDDISAICTGAISPEDYVNTAKWLVGYFWGGGNMVGSGSYGGGYYQPLDIVNRKEDVQRYLKILSCRTSHQSSGYTPNESYCASCTVENCPFCKYECKSGSWENEPIMEEDPRIPVYRALTKRFEELYPGYTLRGWCCSFTDGGMDSEAWVRANTRYNENDPYSFKVWLPSEVVRGLLSHDIEVENADEFVKNITFRHTEWNEEGHPVVTLEHIKELFVNVNSFCRFLAKKYVGFWQRVYVGAKAPYFNPIF